VAYIVGLFGAYLYALRLTKRRDIWIADTPTRIPETIPNEPMLSDLMFYALLGIILGGRIGYLILYTPSVFIEAPQDIIKVWQGGMSFHGGFLGVVCAGLYASWRHKVDKFRIGDMAAVGAPIGLPNDPDLLVRHPSQLYEAFLEGLVLFLILRFLTVRYKALTKPGIIFGSLVFFYGIFRFGVEFVRQPDNPAQIAPFGEIGSVIITRGMTYSVPMIIIGAMIIVWAKRRAPVSPKRIADKADD